LALALPTEGTPPFPGVIVIHDILAFSADLQRHCRRFADAGYAALAPDLYQGRNPGCVVKTLTSMATGVAGFCMGGGFALIAAADQSFAVAAPFLPHAKRLARHLEELGIEHELHIYEEAGRSFMNQLEGRLAPLGRHLPIHAFYEPHTEAKAWSKLLTFFGDRLAVPKPLDLS